MTPRQVRALLRAWERQLGVRWVQAIADLVDDMPVTALARMIELGEGAQAIENVAAARMRQFFAEGWTQAYGGSAAGAALTLQRATGVPMAFDVTNHRAVQALSENRLRLVTGFTDTQRRATQQAITRSFQTGANPVETARAFRQSIGLTPGQERAVANFRESLESGSRRALGYRLRDARFDRTVLAGTGRSRTKELTREQVDRMVSRYRERMVAHRAKTIARTEALRSVHMGQDRMYQQAVQEGVVEQGSLEKEWESAGDDGRTRDTHLDLHGQTQPMDMPFVSSSGALLMHPGDPSAPAEETVHCRCAQGVRMKEVLAPAGIAGIEVV